MCNPCWTGETTLSARSLSALDLYHRSKCSLQSLPVHSRPDVPKAGIPPPPASSPASFSAHTASHWSNCLGIPFHPAAGHRSALLYAAVSAGPFDPPPSTRLTLGYTPVGPDSSPLPDWAVLPHSNLLCRHISRRSGKSASSVGQFHANLPLHFRIYL